MLSSKQHSFLTVSSWVDKTISQAIDRYSKDDKFDLIDHYNKAYESPDSPYQKI